jgi:hypothetical protein
LHPVFPTSRVDPAADADYDQNAHSIRIGWHEIWFYDTTAGVKAIIPFHYRLVFLSLMLPQLFALIAQILSKTREDAWGRVWRGPVFNSTGRTREMTSYPS